MKEAIQKTVHKVLLYPQELQKQANLEDGFRKQDMVIFGAEVGFRAWGKVLDT